MPNGVKYSTTTPSGSLRRDNVALGVNGNLGPTANTGFYSMPAPVSGKYIINKVAASGVPNFFAPQNDTELIQFARNEGATGADTGSAAAVLAWIATQPNLEAANFEYESIVTEGLIMNLDAGFVGSYPTINTTLYDLSGKGNDGTLINGVGFTNSGVPRFQLDGTDDRIQVPKDLNGFTHNIQYDIDWTIECWMYTYTPDGTPQSYKQIYGNYNGCNYTALKGNGQGILIYNANNSATCFMNFGFGPKNTGVPCCSPSQCPEISLNFTNAETSWFYNDAVNKWCHFVMTSDDGTYYKIYINGVQQGSTKTLDFKNSQSRIDNNLTSTSNYSWGGNNSTAFNEVDFSCMRIYNKPLSASEVLQNYNAQKSRFGL